MNHLLKTALLLALTLSLASPFNAIAGTEVNGTSDDAFEATSNEGFGIYATSYAPAVFSPFLGTTYYAGIYAEGVDRGVWAAGANGVYATTTDSDGYGIVSYSPKSFGFPSNVGGQIFLGKVCTEATFFGCSTAVDVFRIDRAGAVYANGYYAIGADVAEHIPVIKVPTLADVVEIDPDHEGFFRPAESPNSTMVAGVISSNPGLTMNATDPAGGKPDQAPKLALTGRVPVKVSAENGAIKPGDLLVSSSTAGHAMRAPSNPLAGTIIGKALSSLKQGTGTVEMLIMLR